MKIHTLGPKESDSNFAYEKILAKNSKLQNCILQLHESFSEIYENINNYSGDLFLVPVAYRGTRKFDNWTDNNFKYCKKLKILNCYSFNTKPMLLIENSCVKQKNAIIHPSTISLLQNSILISDFKIDFANSKPQAFKKFCQMKYKYCIASEDVFKQSNFINKFNVKYKYTPEMIWCIYKIL